MRRYLFVTRLLGLTYLVRRPVRSLLAVITIGASVAVAGSVAIQFDSYRSAFSGATQQLADVAPLRVDSVTSHGGLEPSVVDRLRQVNGVEVAVPIVQAVTVLDEPRQGQSFILALGVDCSVEALVGSFGCSPNQAGAADPLAPPLVSPSLAAAAGRDAVLLTDDVDIPLATAPQVALLDELNGGRVVVFPLAQAQQLFDRDGSVDAVYVRPVPGTDLKSLRSDLSALLDGRGLVASTSSAPPEARQALRALPPLAMVAFIAVAVGALMVFSLMRLAYEDRRRAYATAWALGSRPTLVLGATLTEASVLGALGGLLGLGASVLVSRPLVDSLSNLTEVFAGTRVTPRVGIVAVLITMGLGLIIGLAAAMVSSWWLFRDFLPSLLPGRNANDRQPTTAPAKPIIGLVLIAGVGLLAAFLAGRHGGIESWQQPVGMVGLVTTFVGLVAASSLLVPIVLSSVGRRMVGSPGLFPLTVVDAARNSRRAVAVALTAASAVGLAAILAGVQTAVREGSGTFATTFVGDRVMVTKFEPMTPDLSGLVDARFGSDFADELRAHPSVSMVDEAYFLYLRTNNPPNTAVSADTGNLPDYPVVEGTLPTTSVPRGEAIIGTGLARVRQLHAGSMLSVPTPSGPRQLRVAAIWEENSAVGNSITMSGADFREFWGDQPPIFLAVRPAPGVSLEELKDDLVASVGAGALIQTPSDYTEEIERVLLSILDPFWTLQQTLLIVVSLVTFVLLLLFGLQRVRQQAILQSLGLRPSQLVILSSASAALVGIAGAVFGATGGFIAGQAARWNGVFVVGTTPPFRAPDLALFVAVCLATLAVVIGSIVPAVVTLRTDVAARLRYE